MRTGCRRLWEETRPAGDAGTRRQGGARLPGSFSPPHSQGSIQHPVSGRESGSPQKGTGLAGGTRPHLLGTSCSCWPVGET